MALASVMFSSLTPYVNSFGRLNKATGGRTDLTNPEHRIVLIEWLNDWGCRHLSEDQHEIASNGIWDWYRVDGANLFAIEKPLWDLQDHDLRLAAQSYGFLKDKTAALRARGESKQEVHIGATAASKILFAIRPKALMPWDEAMRVRFQYDGSPESYAKYLGMIRGLTFHVRNLCRNKGFEIDDLPKILERPNSTVLSLVNEFVWVTETRKVKLPPSLTLARWAELG